MEYLGLAGMWRRFEDYVSSEPEILALIMLAAAFALLLLVNRILKR